MRFVSLTAEGNQLELGHPSTFCVAGAFSQYRWQLTQCPGETSRRTGVSVSHGSKRLGQRGWNRQPAGTWMGLGGSPSRMIRCRLVLGSVTGIADRRACV